MTMRLLMRIECDRCGVTQVIDPTVVEKVEDLGWTQGSRDLCPTCLRYVGVLLRSAVSTT